MAAVAATTEENIDENTFETAKMENDNRVEFVTDALPYVEDSNTNNLYKNTFFTISKMAKNQFLLHQKKA